MFLCVEYEYRHWSVPKRALTGLVTEPRGSLPSGMSATGSRLAAATRTFDALPFVSVIRAFQGPGLRKHPGVGLDDLLHT